MRYYFHFHQRRIDRSDLENGYQNLTPLVSFSQSASQVKGHAVRPASLQECRY